MIERAVLAFRMEFVEPSSFSFCFRHREMYLTTFEGRSAHEVNKTRATRTRMNAEAFLPKGDFKDIFVMTIRSKLETTNLGLAFAFIQHAASRIIILSVLAKTPPLELKYDNWRGQGVN